MAEINNYPITIKLPVMWSDMDAYRHVNNNMYFKYLEIVRHKFYEETGLFDMKEKIGVGPIVKKLTCIFEKPVSYPDNLTIGTCVKSIGKSSFTMEYIVISERIGVAARGDGVVVTFDYNSQKKTAIPEQTKKALENMEKK